MCARARVTLRVCVRVLRVWKRAGAPLRLPFTTHIPCPTLLIGHGEGKGRDGKEETINGERGGAIGGGH